MRGTNLAPAAALWAWTSAAQSEEPPAEYPANPAVGPGGTAFKDSPHFRIYDVPSEALADSALASLESAYTCFVTDLNWRSPGLGFQTAPSDEGPRYKVNVYNVGTGLGAAANTGLDWDTGMSFINVEAAYVGEASVTVHEFGHSLTYAAGSWIEQWVTGAWWEPVANFVADTWLTSDLCASAREAHGQPRGDSLINLRKTVGDSWQVIVDGSPDTGNYYDAWPFLAYVHRNPDGYAGLGLAAFPGVWTAYEPGSNVTPLHVLQALAAPARIQEVVGRYWARMAYVDIGHEKAREAFERARAAGELDYGNLDALGDGRYRVRAGRRPQYMGANINPLRGTGYTVWVRVEADMAFTATLAVRGRDGVVRYVDLVDGIGEAAVEEGAEASLVVANTPETLINYDPFELTDEVRRGLDYTVELGGATA